MLSHLDGLLAATFTPFRPAGEVDLACIPDLVERAVAGGIAGLYVCGSTGEGPLLTAAERRDVAAAYVRAVAGRLPVIVQVGHDSLAEARGLARHADEIGADAISAAPPVYFKPQDLGQLVTCLAELAGAAPRRPFVYYHIPALTGLDVPGLALLEAAARVPNFAGIKYTTPTLDDYQACVEAGGERYQVFFGRDEMMLPALASGARAFIGSTYNFIAPVYHALRQAWERGDIAEARAHMARAQALVRLIPRHGGGCLKAMMSLLQVEVGPTRAPLAAPDRDALAADLEVLGVHGWL